MADVSVKMGVSGVQQFKQGMTEAQTSIKTLDAALKANEKALKATGDAESYMEGQTTLLNQKLKQQQSIVKNAEAALKQMEQNGVKTTSTAYQNMQRKLIEAQSGILDTQMELENLGTKAAGAAEKTDQLSSSLGGLNKKISLDQVISGIGSITSAMENAGKKAVELGKKIWENITDSARWADDAATQAMILNMDVEDYQRYKKVFDTVGEITVQEWQKAKQKVQKAINDPTQEQTDILGLLGISTHDILQGKNGPVQGAARGFEEVFWEIGKTLKAKVESGEMTQDLADTYANALFGKGFAQLNPMFALGQEGFAAALEQQNVVTEESVNKLASLNDQLNTLEGDFNTLKSEVLAGLAPALEKAASALDDLLTRLMEYLQKPEGQKALADMEKAVSGLFDDLSKIDPETVVQGFAEVFNNIVSGLQWLSENSGNVIGALEAIVGGWAALKLTGGALEILKLINGLQGLGILGGGAGGAAGAAGGGLLSSVNTWLTGAGATVTSLINGGMQNMAPAAFDWLLNNSPLASVLNGNESWDAWWQRQQAEQQERTETFGDNWNPDSENANVIAQFIGQIRDVYKNQIDYWTKVGNQQQLAAEWTLGDEYTADEIMAMINGGNPVPVEVSPEPEEGAAEDLSSQIGTVHVDVVGDIVQISDRRSRMGTLPEHANGLWSVPFDGYMAALHKGEQVVPAREVSSRSYSSNLYVESMYMNNGQDAEGLAAAIDARNRRTMRGWGSR